MNACGTRGGDISRAFVGAPEVLFDDSSKIVFMSDMHRGDAGGADAFYPYRNIFAAALTYYDASGFTYVELGDSDELWENREFSEIWLTYGNIFESLAVLYEQDRYLGVVGNHDIVKKRPRWPEENMKAGEGDEAVELFPGITFPPGLVFKHREKGWKIHVLHGHQADVLNSDLWLISRFLVRYLWRPLTLLGVKNPLRAANNHKKKRSIECELATWAKQNNTMVVAGHTHRIAFPKPGEPRYFNDGCCVRKEVMTAIEIVRGGVALVQWGIKSTDEGFLCVTREVVHGPVPLVAYFPD